MPAQSPPVLEPVEFGAYSLLFPQEQGIFAKNGSKTGRFWHDAPEKRHFLLQIQRLAGAKAAFLLIAITGYLMTRNRVFDRRYQAILRN